MTGELWEKIKREKKLSVRCR